MSLSKETIKKAVGMIVPSMNETEFTAQRAWIETTYGKGAFRSLEKRIADKQTQIRARIERHFCNGEPSASDCSYYCTIEIEADLEQSTEEVFKPFKENGFNVTNLSALVEDLAGDNVYLISWRNAFKGNNALIVVDCGEEE